MRSSCYSGMIQCALIAFSYVVVIVQLQASRNGLIIRSSLRIGLLVMAPGYWMRLIVNYQDHILNTLLTVPGLSVAAYDT